MSVRNLLLYIIFPIVFVSGGCSKQSDSVTVLKKFPIDDINEVITQSGVEIDKDVSADGKGSLRIKTKEPVIISLIKVGDVDVDDARLIYQARIRTKGVEGKVYLEMWCHFPRRGESPLRGIESPLTGTTKWAIKDISFTLNKGEKPDYVRLNIVINGKGTVWVDDIRLLKAPLK